LTIVQFLNKPISGYLPLMFCAMDADYAAILGQANVWVLSSRTGVQGALVTHAMGDHLFLETVAVAPGAQGRGYGALLLARADQDAYEAGLDEIRLYTNVAMTENLSFYPRHGYVETGRESRDGFNRVFFARSLGSSGHAKPPPPSAPPASRTGRQQ
jgi:GNAT superfamily N-acetyltransferase